jgi:hypothetical protein
MARRSGESPDRTWSLWGFVVLFVVLAAAGLAAFLLISPPGSETVALPVDVTSTTAAPAEPRAPGDGADASDGRDATVGPVAPTAGAGAGGGGAGSASPPVTFPDGSPAPEGAQQVLVDGAITTVSFATPRRLATVPVLAVVPPVTVTPVAGVSGIPASALRLSVVCAATADEALAQISVTEDALSVTVLPVVIAPVDGGPCGSTPLRELVIPLRAPVGSRDVRAVPQGTSVPTPAPGA